MSATTVDSGKGTVDNGTRGAFASTFYTGRAGKRTLADGSLEIAYRGGPPALAGDTAATFDGVAVVVKSARISSLSSMVILQAVTA